MSPQSVLTSLALPPLALLPLVVLLGVLAGRGWRPGGYLAALSAALLFLLATPMAAGLLLASLEREVASAGPLLAGADPPGAIVVLSAETVGTATGPDVGPLTLERVRAGAILQRRTGLPLLVTGGSLSPEEVPVAALMAGVLVADFGATVRWVEPRARDTRENAIFSAALLRAAGIGRVYLVSHAWHLPRARDAFARQGLPVVPAPVRIDRPPASGLVDWVPRADHWGESWFALREWAGRLVYALRD